MNDQLLAIGVDGAPGGWVAAACFGTGPLGDGAIASARRRTEPMFFRDIRALADWRSSQAGGEHAPVAVDIPIGLPELVSYRECDKTARARLPNGRKGAVFHAPGRHLLEHATAAANGKPPSVKVVFARVQELVKQRQAIADAEAAAAQQAASKVLSLSQQGAGILLKVAEVDTFLREQAAGDEHANAGIGERQDWLFEVHPEMCFRAMNDNEVPPRKPTAHGQLQRLDLVRREFPDADARIRAWNDGDRYSLLDICDAYAALWTALRWARTDGGELGRRSEVTPPLEVLGEVEPGRSPREDDTGLLMRMVV